MTTNAFDIDAPVLRCSNCGGPQEKAGLTACQYCGVALGPVQTTGVAGPPWTLFWDMHSGGGTKVKPFDKIYIQDHSGERDPAGGARRQSTGRRLRLGRRRGCPRRLSRPFAYSDQYRRTN
jgi:hypothetical protein